MQFPARRLWACKTDTKNRSTLRATNTKRWKCVEKKELQRQESVWEDSSTAVQNFLKSTCTELPCDKWRLPECQFEKSESGCKFGAACSFPHWRVEEQPNTKPNKGGDKSAVAAVKDVRHLGCVVQDAEPPESSLSSRKGPKVLGPIRRVRFTRATLRQSNIAWSDSTQKSSSAQPLRYENWRQISGRDWKPGAMRPRRRVETCQEHLQARREGQSYILSRSDEEFAAASVIKAEERVVVDSGANMHTVNKRDLNSAELETMRMSKNPTMVMTANSEVQIREDPTVYVREVNLSVTVMLLEDTPAVLSLGKLCEDHGYNYQWTRGQKPHLFQNGRKIDRMQHGELCTIRCPWSIDKLFKLSFTNISHIFIEGSRHSYTASRMNKKRECEWWMKYEETRRMDHQKPKNKLTWWQRRSTRKLVARSASKWLEEFREYLVDERVPEHREASSSFHELPSEPRAKVESGKHSVFTHLPKDRNCDIC